MSKKQPKPKAADKETVAAIYNFPDFGNIVVTQNVGNHTYDQHVFPADPHTQYKIIMKKKVVVNEPPKAEKRTKTNS